MNDDNTITIPVRARMRLQPDGTWAMIEADFATYDVRDVASFIGKRLGLSIDQEQEPHESNGGGR